MTWWQMVAAIAVGGALAALLSQAITGQLGDRLERRILE